MHKVYWVVREQLLQVCNALQSTEFVLCFKVNFYSFQTKHALPVVRDMWSKMRHIVLEILKGYDDICIWGDGQNDSPGDSAWYYVHTPLEHATKELFDLEVIDNRETGGNSTTMEREALRRLLERLVIELPLGELCTDASSTIIKLVRDMKGRLCDFSEKPVMLYYFYCCCLFFISKFFLITHFIIFTVA